MAFALAFFTVNVVFMLQVLGAGQGYLADRFTYVGYAGLFWGLAYGFQRLRARGLGTPLQVGVGGLRAPAGGVCVSLHRGLGRRRQALGARRRGLPQHRHRLRQPRDFGCANADRPPRRCRSSPRAIAADPTAGTYLNSRGKLHFDEGRTPEAIADYTAGLQREPELAELLINRGAAFAKTGNYAAAEADLDSGLELEPDNFNGYLNRSLAVLHDGPHGRRARGLRDDA